MLNIVGGAVDLIDDPENSGEKIGNYAGEGRGTLTDPKAWGLFTTGISGAVRMD